MITPIGNNNYTTAYSNTGKKQTSKEDVPKFLLGDEEGVVYEPTGKKDSTKENALSLDSTVKNDQAAYMTLSIDAKDTKNIEEKKSFLDGILEGVRGFFARIAKFIWYGEGKEDKAKATDSEPGRQPGLHLEIRDFGDEAHTSEDVEASVEPQNVEETGTDSRNISPKEQYESYVQGRRLAHNSTLLTHYDKHGNIVKVDGSDSDRLLLKDKTYTV